MSEIVKVGVNGYGVIGKRVADAVAAQDDMELVGVADVINDYRIRVAVERGYPVYASIPDRRAAMAEAGLPIAGTIEELLGKVDIMVDCTPKGIGAANKPLYEHALDKRGWIKRARAVLLRRGTFLPRTVPERQEHAAMARNLEAAGRAFVEEGFKGAEEPVEIPERTEA